MSTSVLDQAKSAEPQPQPVRKAKQSKQPGRLQAADSQARKAARRQFRESNPDLLEFLNFVKEFETEMEFEKDVAIPNYKVWLLPQEALSACLDDVGDVLTASGETCMEVKQLRDLYYLTRNERPFWLSPRFPMHEIIFHCHDHAKKTANPTNKHPQPGPHSDQ